MRSFALRGIGSPPGWRAQLSCSRRSRRRALYPLMPSVAKMPSILLTIDRRSLVKSSRSRFARRASSSASLGIGTIEQTRGSRLSLLTANNQVPYMLTSLNLRSGPVVVEIPAAGEKAVLFGSFVDNWQAPIVDVGPSGEDEGKGGKYLFLPPGYSEPTPEGYIPVRMQGYVVAGGLRPVPANGGTAEDAHAYALQVKVYPLADAAAPKPTRFIEGFPKPFHSLPVYESSWFRELAAFVNEEPVRERDKVMMGMLSSIGIERGKPFAPDAMRERADARVLHSGFDHVEYDVRVGAAGGGRGAGLRRGLPRLVQNPRAFLFRRQRGERLGVLGAKRVDLLTRVEKRPDRRLVGHSKFASEPQFNVARVAEDFQNAMLKKRKTNV